LKFTHLNSCSFVLELDGTCVLGNSGISHEKRVIDMWLESYRLALIVLKQLVFASPHGYLLIINYFLKL